MFLEDMTRRVDDAYAAVPNVTDPAERRALQAVANALSDTRDKIEQNIAAGEEQEEPAATEPGAPPRKKKGAEAQ